MGSLLLLIGICIFVGLMALAASNRVIGKGKTIWRIWYNIIIFYFWGRQQFKWWWKCNHFLFLRSTTDNEINNCAGKKDLLVSEWDDIYIIKLAQIITYDENENIPDEDWMSTELSYLSYINL